MWGASMRLLARIAHYKGTLFSITHDVLCLFGPLRKPVLLFRRLGKLTPYAGDYRYIWISRSSEFGAGRAESGRKTAKSSTRDQQTGRWRAMLRRKTGMRETRAKRRRALAEERKAEGKVKA